MFSGRAVFSAGTETSVALTAHSEALADALVRCDKAIRRRAGRSVLPVLRGEQEASGHAADAAWFAFGCALDALWRSLGVQSDAVTGDGSGAITAAYVSGALTLDQAVTLVTGQGGEQAVPAMPTVRNLLDERFRYFVEVSTEPSSVQTEADGTETEVHVVGSSGDRDGMLRRLADLVSAGVSPDWSTVLPTGSPVALPTYAFERGRYWMSPTPTIPVADVNANANAG